MLRRNGKLSFRSPGFFGTLQKHAQNNQGSITRHHTNTSTVLRRPPLHAPLSQREPPSSLCCRTNIADSSCPPCPQQQPARSTKMAEDARNQRTDALNNVLVLKLFFRQHHLPLSSRQPHPPRADEVDIGSCRPFSRYYSLLILVLGAEADRYGNASPPSCSNDCTFKRWHMSAFLPFYSYPPDTNVSVFNINDVL